MNIESDFYVEALFKKYKIQEHYKHNKKSIIIPSTIVYQSVIQNHIIKNIIEAEQKNDNVNNIGMVNQLYYSDMRDDTKEIMYEMIEGFVYYFKYDGHEISAVVEKITPTMSLSYEIKDYTMLFMHADTREIMENFIKSVLLPKKIQDIFHYSTDTSYWKKVGSIKNRDTRTLVLKEGIQEDIFYDIDEFIKSKDDYDKFGIPYKKVYLFHGEPGTGKTSLSQILAHRTNRSLYVLNFDAKMTDDGLCNAIKKIIPTTAILLIEDIDCMFKKRDPANNVNVSFSALLNILDGALMNEGLITIMTTNDIDCIDPALRRPMRVDKTIKFEKADKEQIKKIFDLYEIKINDNVFQILCSVASDYNICPSGISGFLFRNRKTSLNDANIIQIFKMYIKENSMNKSSNHNFYS